MPRTASAGITEFVTVTVQLADSYRNIAVGGHVDKYLAEGSFVKSGVNKLYDSSLDSCIGEDFHAALACNIVGDGVADEVKAFKSLTVCDVGQIKQRVLADADRLKRSVMLSAAVTFKCGVKIIVECMGFGIHFHVQNDLS